MKKLLSAFIGLCACASVQAQNPFLPLWEYIPDGEPYIFEDPDRPGKYRVYLYGSHDNLITAYCGRDQVVWSAPIDDLSQWRYDGVIFKSVKDANGNNLNRDGIGDVLYAPDIAMRYVTKTIDGKEVLRPQYYLYPNNQGGGRNGQVAVSDRPDGPFTVINWSKNNPKTTDGILGFDPAVFIDDDGKVYGYWGFEESNGAELDPVTMATVKQNTAIVKDMISNYKQPGVFRFFEASSMRKIEDKYVFIYSRWTADGDGGLPETNYTLAYAYSDNPLGPFTYGGTIIDARARDTDENGKVIPTANPYGNTHGSIVKINDQWWVFYHRQSGEDEYSRQAMVAPINVKVEKGKGGKVIISEAEYTSEGFKTQGLNPFELTPAAIACYLTNPDTIGHEYPQFIFNGSYVKPLREGMDAEKWSYSMNRPYNLVVNNTSGSVVGYKYFNFAQIAPLSSVYLNLHYKPEGVSGKMNILIGGPSAAKGGKLVGSLQFKSNEAKEWKEAMIRLEGIKGLKGKQSLFFVFESAEKGKSLCELADFIFVK